MRKKVNSSFQSEISNWKCFFKHSLNLISFFIFCAFFTSRSSAQTNVMGNYTFKTVNMGGAGWVTGLVFHPTASNVVYCRTDVGGAFKWIASANRWEPLVTKAKMNALLSLPTAPYGPGARGSNFYEVESIGLDPQNSNTVYVAMGSEYDANGGVIAKSTDGGASFSILTGLGNVNMAGNGILRTSGERLVVNPSNSSKLLFGSRKNGLRVSNDGGATWSLNSNLPAGTKVNENGTSGSADVGINSIVFENGNRVYASVAGQGIYKSEDGGTTWSNILGLMATEMRVVGGKLYALCTKQGLRIYTPSSNSWVTKTPNNEIVDMAIKPGDANVIYTCTDGLGRLYRTLDGGTNWSEVNTNSNTGRNNVKSSLYPWKENTDLRDYLSIGEIEFNPNDGGDMWFAEGMGTFRATGITNTSTPVFNDNSTGIEELVANGVYAAPGGKLNVVGWDRLGFHYTNPDNAPSFQLGLTQEFTSGWSIAASPTDRNFIAVAVTDHRDFDNSNNSGFSTDGGTTWTKFGSVPNNSMFGEIAISANDNNNMVWKPRNYGTAFYFTKNRGASWQTANISGFEDDNSHYLGFKRVVAADGATAGKFYILSNSNGKIYSTTDGGANWSQVGASPHSWSRTVKMRSAPGIANHLWVVSGHNSEFVFPQDQTGLHFSSNGGASFTKMAGFDEAWAMGFGAKQNSGQAYPTIFVYGRYNNTWGLFRSVDQGANWARCAEYVLDRLNSVNDICGDPDVFGKVYLAQGATGFSYGVTNETSGGGNTNVAVTGVTMSPTTASIAVGATTTLSATVAPSNATNKNVTWSSSNTGVATVSTSGVVTGVTAGSATITVTTADGNRTATCAVTVTTSNVAVTGVTMSPTTASVAVGATTSLSATVNPSNATNKNVTWSSSNTGVATVSTTGVVTGVAAGSATITVTTADGNRTATSAVTVTAASGGGGGGTGVVIYDEALASGWSASGWNTTYNLAATSPVYAGTKSLSVQFTAAWGAVNIEKSSAQSTSGLTGMRLWINTNGGANRNLQMVYFNNAGTETGRKNFPITNGWNQYTILFSEVGNPTDIKRFYIHDGSGSAQSAIFVDNIELIGTGGGGSTNVAVTSVTMSPTSASVALGATTTLSATVNPSNATNKNVTWSSSNTGVATVSSTGVVTGVAAGSATITVTTADGNRTATSAITVTAASGGGGGGSTGSLVIYDEAYAATWSAVTLWAGNIAIANTGQTGSKSLQVNITDGWGAGYLRTTSAVRVSDYPGGFSFWIKGNGTQNVVINFQSDDNQTSVGSFTQKLTTGWVKVDKTWASIGVANSAVIKTIRIGTDVGTSGTNYSFNVDVFTLKKTANGRLAADAEAENESNTEFLVGPNPSSDVINITKAPVNANIQLFNLTGKPMWNGKANAQGSASINVSSFNSGLYTISVGAGCDKPKTKKVQINR
jgi:uncharacterized protein YjdB